MAKSNETTKKRRGGAAPIGLAIAILTVALGIALSSCGKKGEPTTPAAYQVPDSPVASTNVKQSLGALRGKVVILDFWATWCGPCRSEIPSFVSLQAKYRARGLEIVGVSLDPITPGGRPEAVAPFMRDQKINYTIFTVNSPTATAGYDYTRGIPTTYIINREGQIVNTFLGARPQSDFEQAIQRLL